MEEQILQIQVDKKGTKIEGNLLMPDGDQDQLIIFVPGFMGKHKDYTTHFGAILGNEVPTYISNMRRGGLAPAEQLVEDQMSIDDHLRNIVETDNILYIGHSTGANIAVEMYNQSDKMVQGIYAICAYPSLGDTRTNNEDPKVGSMQQTIGEYIGKSNFGPFGYPLKEQNIRIPMRFAIGEKDGVVGTKHPPIARRFMKYFSEVSSDSSSRIFEGMNHCFNYKPFKLVPFNESNPNLLIDDILNFYLTLDQADRGGE